MSNLPLLEEAGTVQLDRHMRAIGYVFGDSRFADGTQIMTSRIRSWDPVTRIVETNDSLYQVMSMKGDMDYLLDQIESEYRHNNLIS